MQWVDCQMHRDDGLALQMLRHHIVGHGHSLELKFFSVTHRNLKSRNLEKSREIVPEQMQKGTKPATKTSSPFLPEIKYRMILNQEILNVEHVIITRHVIAHALNDSNRKY